MRLSWVSGVARPVPGWETPLCCLWGPEGWKTPPHTHTTSTTSHLHSTCKQQNWGWAGLHAPCCHFGPERRAPGISLMIDRTVSMPPSKYTNVTRTADRPTSSQRSHSFPDSRPCREARNKSHCWLWPFLWSHVGPAPASTDTEKKKKKAAPVASLSTKGELIKNI